MPGCRQVRTAKVRRCMRIWPRSSPWPDLSWPADKLFPLTPFDARHVLQGWKVRPAGGLTMD